MPISRTVRLGLVAAPAAVLAAALPLLPRIPQNPDYHRFADQRSRAGIPNFNDVASNAAFALAGAWGLWAMRRREAFARAEERTPWTVLFVSAIGIGAGSAYYHLKPDLGRLVWDRLPMSTAFMAALDAAIVERISARGGRRALLPLLALGAGSVIAWYASEHAGRGDLRLYAFTQAAPFLTLPLLLALFPSPYTNGGGWVRAIGCYGAAKVCELLDKQLFHLTGELISGHTLKHLLAGLGFYCLGSMLRTRNQAL